MYRFLQTQPDPSLTLEAAKKGVLQGQQKVEGPWDRFGFYAAVEGLITPAKLWKGIQRCALIASLAKWLENINTQHELLIIKEALDMI